MAVATTKVVLITALVFFLCGCKPQVGNIVVTNETNRALSDVKVEVPDLNSDFNRLAGTAMVGTLSAGGSTRSYTKGRPVGNLVVSWTEPDGTAVVVRDSLGERGMISVEIVIQEDGSIQVHEVVPNDE